MKFEIEGNIIDCDVQYGKRKKIAIQISSTGFITVKAPRETSEEMLRSAIEKQGKWILDKLQKIKDAREAPKTREYHDQGKFLYLGKEYLLHQLIDHSDLGEKDLKKALKKFYISSCKKIVGERIKIYQKQLGVKPKSVEIIESKVKWGSCSWDKKISINYQLAMAPIDVIDYVIIHELCHILHMNHDRSFWRRVGSLVPDYKKKEEYLARHGQSMTV
ncbi:M48 family metallopeptidase [Anaerobacillus sp. CMMVII]|uniref:M48 family metallopeptidase n=1 Tax=Anaerobacillus sp. CMMVII TaxID=2755588 RepID=UPI0021B7E352|nr:SprT family zinc-dependent metalloprotease [Anaerobacillus sp. CMMVII]MCT8139170.1 M48 family metallopeptidase [Anaerobacillus sp. CMMVII]